MAAFRDHSSFEVIGAYVQQNELPEELGHCHPDAVIWKVPSDNPAAITKAVAELRVHCPFTVPIVLVDNPQRLNLEELLLAGVRGCLPLRLLPRQIVQATELILKAGILCLPRLPASDWKPVPSQFLKPGARNRTEAVILALQASLAYDREP